MTRILFAHDHRFLRVGSRFFSPGKLPYRAWRRYLKRAPELWVVSRVTEADKIPPGYEESSGAGVQFVPLPNLNSLTISLRRGRLARARMEEAVSSCDAVIARLPSRLGIAAVNAAKRRGKPFGVELVGSPRSKLRSHGSRRAKLIEPILTWQVRRAVREARAVLYVTRHILQDQFPTSGREFAASNVEVPPLSENVLEQRLSRIEGLSHNLRVGFIGQVDSRIKGLDTAIMALARARKSHPRFSLHLLGGGDETRGRLLARRVGVANHIYFEGLLPAGEPVRQWLDSIDLYIQPSRAEGLPRATIEAMSRAAPVICSDVDGNPELVGAEALHAPGDWRKLAYLLVNLGLDKTWLSDQARQNWNSAHDYQGSALDAQRDAFVKSILELKPVSEAFGQRKNS